MFDIQGLCSSLQTKPLQDEADYANVWHDNMQTDWTPEMLAFAGGYLADRLAFLFIAGYQCAIQRTFNISGNLWSALAVSEDAKGEKPGLTLDDHGQINGFKTWVAAAANLDELIVSVGKLPDATFYRVDRMHSGVHLHLKSNVTFLADMSQGIAEFTNVPADTLTEVIDVDMRLFAKREPLYLYIAFCGWMKKQSIQEADTILADLLTIADGDFSDERHKQLFADADNRLSDLLANLPPATFNGDFAADKGLISLYSRGIQKRAGRG